MIDRQLDTETVVSWALAFAILVGVTMCLRVITLEVDAHFGSATSAPPPPQTADAARP